MDSIKLNSKPHKFFEAFLDLDNNNLSNLLLRLESKMLDGSFSGISEIDAKNQGHNSMTTYFADKYNIFLVPDKDIYDLLKGLRNTMIDVCAYYDLDFDDEKYYIWGWINVDHKDNSDAELDDFSGLYFHDHFGGHGAPYFHGYYAVNAEDSYTPYLINKTDLFLNKNINGRALISETGHPHTRGIWKSDSKRLTIAYDIAPLRTIAEMDNKWVPLF